MLYPVFNKTFLFEKKNKNKLWISDMRWRLICQYRLDWNVHLYFLDWCIFIYFQALSHTTDTNPKMVRNHTCYEKCTRHEFILVDYNCKKLSFSHLYNSQLAITEKPDFQPIQGNASHILRKTALFIPRVPAMHIINSKRKIRL